MERIPESDWKKLRALKDQALAKACDDIMDKVAALLAQRDGNAHQTYLELYSLVNQQDRNIALMFDDLRRSNAFDKLMAWKRFGAISDADFERFSPETQGIITRLLG